jgi:hypothetical protein
MTSKTSGSKAKRRDTRKVLLLYRHLAVQALGVSLVVFMCGTGIWGLLSLPSLLAPSLYACAVVVWAIWGSRYVVYIGLQAAGFTFIAVLALLASLRTLMERGQVSAAVVLLVSYVASAVALAVVGVRRWRNGPSGFIARPVNWEKGTYDVGALAAFFFDAKLGRARRSELATNEDRAWLKKRGWLVYLLLFSTPIGTAFLITRDGNTDIVLTAYILALICGFLAVGAWIMCGWFWRWGRASGRPMLVKQFAHRYRRQ